jgi:hypothetical protein
MLSWLFSICSTIATPISIKVKKEASGQKK